MRMILGLVLSLGRHWNPSDFYCCWRVPDDIDVERLAITVKYDFEAV
jgi:hypothetical protein